MCFEIFGSYTIIEFDYVFLLKMIFKRNWSAKCKCMLQQNSNKKR